jgi:hypothetical protein
MTLLVSTSVSDFGSRCNICERNGMAARGALEGTSSLVEVAVAVGLLRRSMVLGLWRQDRRAARGLVHTEAGVVMCGNCRACEAVFARRFGSRGGASRRTRERIDYVVVRGGSVME